MIPKPDGERETGYFRHIDRNSTLWWHHGSGWSLYHTASIRVGTKAPVELLDEVRRARQAKQNGGS